MAWRKIVRIKKQDDRPPLFHPAPGINVIEVVEEPNGPISTRYGLRLPLIIRLPDSGDKFTWLIPWRDEVGKNSLLGQLKYIADEHGGLRGLRLKVVVEGSRGSRQYRVEVVKG